jgi:predicted AAA+ superfamily ATPase
MIQSQLVISFENSYYSNLPRHPIPLCTKIQVLFCLVLLQYFQILWLVLLQFKSVLPCFTEKYATRSSTLQYIRHILRTGFKYGGQRIKFERFGESEYRSREMGEAFRTLEKTMLLELVYPTTATRLPLMPDYKKSPKLMWLDTGLLNFAAGIHTEDFGASTLTDAWRGIVAEHIAGQELLAQNISVLAQRFFWVREAKNSNAEIDFVLPFNAYLIPVEVKSDAGTTLKSLHQFIDIAPHAIAVRISFKSKTNPS